MRTFRAGLLLLAVLFALTGCTFEVAGPPPPSPRSARSGRATFPRERSTRPTASAALAALPVAEKTSLAGYERGCGEGEGCVFGPAWADVDHNGCDQRNDVLHRDLTAGARCARARTTAWWSPACSTTRTPAQTVPFEKADAAEVPIDHVVPLAAAWVQGAAAWPTEQRQAFANDLNNLMATTREENSAKGDSTADEWVPAGPDLRLLVRHRRHHREEPLRAVGHPAEAGALQSLLATC